MSFRVHFPSRAGFAIPLRRPSRSRRRLKQNFSRYDVQASPQVAGSTMSGRRRYQLGPHVVDVLLYHKCVKVEGANVFMIVMFVCVETIQAGLKVRQRARIIPRYRMR